MNMKHICELKEDYESRTGKKMHYVKMPDELSHEEVERRFEEALHVPFLTRTKWFFENLIYNLLYGCKISKQ